MRLLVNVDVDDLDRAIAFYRDGLGLTLARRLFDGAVAELAGAVAPIFLLATTPGASASAAHAIARDFRRHWTPVHLDFVVDDLDAAVARAVAAGAVQEGAVRSEVWGRIAVLADPFGHGLCLVQLSDRGYDAVQSGE